MKIGGFIKTSLIDYTGKIACVIFTAGCNLRCKYCHNPELVLPEKISKLKLIPEDYIFQYIKSNIDLLDAIVITGGEPTLQNDLINFIIKIKSLGLLVKLDTNGTTPKILNKLIDLNLLDYIAMDIKAPLDIAKYQLIAGDIMNIEVLDKIKNSIWQIIKSGIPHEFRTTVVKQFLSKEDIYKISQSIKGCDSYCLQNYNPDVVLDENIKSNTGYPQKVLELISDDLDINKENIVVR